MPPSYSQTHSLPLPLPWASSISPCFRTLQTGSRHPSLCSPTNLGGHFPVSRMAALRWARTPPSQQTVSCCADILISVTDSLNTPYTWFGVRPEVYPISKQTPGGRERWTLGAMVKGQLDHPGRPWGAAGLSRLAGACGTRSPNSFVPSFRPGSQFKATRDSS